MAVTTNSLKAWILASRPKTLGAIICPILMGNAFAFHHHSFSTQIFVVTLFTGVLLQILANVANDYGDFIKGSDKEDRLGPPRAMQMRWITKNAMMLGMGFLFFVSVILGLYLVQQAGPLIFVVGVLVVGLCFGYTLGPLPLAYFGFAEAIIFVVFGPITVLGAYFVQTRALDVSLLVASLSPGFLAAALLLTNNLRDIVQDQRNNKRTIAVRFGEGFARRSIVVLVLCAALPLLMLVLWFSYSPSILLACAALILPVRNLPMILKDPISGRFNLMLSAIGKSLYLFGLIFSLGLLYGSS